MKALITSAAQDAGLVAARSLAKAGFSVIDTDLRRSRSGFKSRYVSEFHPLVGNTESEREEALVRLVDTIRPDVFVPMGSIGVRAAARRREELSAMTAINVVDEASFMAAFDKSVCTSECARLGIDCVRVYSFAEALAVLEGSKGETSVVVKPPWDIGAARGVRYVREPLDLQNAVERCTKTYGGALIEDYIPGDAEAMKTVVLLFGGQSELAAAFTMQKIRHWPQTGGSTAAGCSTGDRELVEMVLPFFRAWHWRGPAEVELKLDPRDGQHKVIEINPRFPGYLRFPWHCGIDLPLMAARLALGQSLPPQGPSPGYRVGQRYVAPTLFARTVRDEIRSLGAWTVLHKARADLRGSAPLILSMLADPLPLLGRILGPARRLPVSADENHRNVT